ncbi:MAG: cell division protein ZapA [Pseudomonadota bacterium]
MPEVTVEVAGRSYRVGCGEGEEAHLARLAQLVDTEASALSKQIGQVSEGRLMLMTALMVADKLSDAQSALGAAERRAVNAEKMAESRSAPSDLFNPEREEEIARNLDALADRIDALAGRMEGTA